MPNQPILEHLWIIPLLPLLGAAINGLFGLKWPNKIVNTVALSSTGLSFAAALEAAREFLGYYEQTHQAFRKELPKALASMDQPSIDGLNSYFVCKAAAELGWKVALSGTGGDELFGGYSTFRTIPRFVRAFGLFRYMPGLARGFERLYGRVMPTVHARFSPKTAHALKYVHSYEGAYLMKRGLFLPEELPSVLGEGIAEEGLRRLAILDRIREAITPDPGSPSGPFGKPCRRRDALCPAE